jgi:hypothetical protein
MSHKPSKVRRPPGKPQSKRRKQHPVLAYLHILWWHFLFYLSGVASGMYWEYAKHIMGGAK